MPSTFFFENNSVSHRLLTSDEQPICSWLVAFVYYRALGYQFGKDPSSIQPDDMIDWCMLTGWKLVWVSDKATAKAFAECYNVGVLPA